MNKNVTMKLAMYERVYSTLRGKQNLMDSSAALANSVEKLNHEINELKALIYSQSDDITWIAARKRNLTDEVVTRAFIINKILIAFANNSGNRDLMNQFHFSVRDYMKGGTHAKLIRVKGLLQVLPDYSSGLTPYGVTQGEIDHLSALTHELDEIMNSARIALNRRSVMTVSIKTAIRRIDHILKVEIDAIMNLFSSVVSTDFLEYRAARKLVHFATKSRTQGAEPSDQDDGPKV